MNKKFTNNSAREIAQDFKMVLRFQSNAVLALRKLQKLILLDCLRIPISVLSMLSR